MIDPYASNWSGNYAGGQSCSVTRWIILTRTDHSTNATARIMQKCRVIDPAFTWGRSRKPEIPWERTIVYEMHVKGFTKLHPLVPETDRGTFAGLACPEVPAYLRSLGVTSAELLPIHTFVDDGYLVDKGLRNYWGYNSIAFFAPEPRYLSR